MNRLKTLVASVVTVVVLGGPIVSVAAQDASSETRRSDLLPGVTLTVQPVESGVVRVESDGFQELSWPVVPIGPKYYDESEDPPGPALWHGAVVGTAIAGNEQGVWIGRPEGIVRLGQEQPVWSAGARAAGEAIWFEATSDGTLYQSLRPRVLGPDGWQRVQTPRLRGFEKHGGGYGPITFAPDGSLWLLGTNGRDGERERDRFARRDADGWSVVKVPLPVPGARSWPGIDDFAVSGDGTLYVWRHALLQRFDGKRWDTFSPGIDQGHDIGGDGSVWMESRTADGAVVFRRLHPNGRDWTVHEVGAPHSAATGGYRYSPATAVGPDGAIWFANGDGDERRGHCDGINRFDGSTTRRYLEGLCVFHTEFGPGGHAWVLANEWNGDLLEPNLVGPVSVYVITTDDVQK